MHQAGIQLLEPFTRGFPSAASVFAVLVRFDVCNFFFSQTSRDNHFIHLLIHSSWLPFKHEPSFLNQVLPFYHFHVQHSPESKLLSWIVYSILWTTGLVLFVGRQIHFPIFSCISTSFVFFPISIAFSYPAPKCYQTWELGYLFATSLSWPQH